MTENTIFRQVDRKTLENIPVIIALHNTQNNILWANKLYREATGRSLSEIEGKKCYSVWGLKKPCRNCPVLVALDSGEPAEAELTPSSQDQWPESQGSWLSKAEPIKDEKNNIIGAIEVAINITTRKKTEEELRAHKKFSDSIIDHSPYPMWVADSEGTVIKTNRALLETLRLTDEQILGNYNVFRDENLKKQDILSKARASLKKGLPIRFSIPWKAADAGEEGFLAARDLYIDAALYPIMTSSGGMSHIVCQWVDITELKKTEEELRRQRTMLARTESIAHLGSWEWDISRDQVTWSEELFNITGLDPAEGAPSFSEQSKIYTPEDMKRLRKAVEACREKGIPYELEVQIKRPDGEKRYCIDSGRAESEPGEPVSRLVGFLQDITERRQAEETLRESNAKYRNLFEAASDAIYLIALDDGIIAEANSVACRMLGRTKEEILGLSIEDIDPNYPLEEFIKFWKDRPEEQPLLFESSHKKKNGALFPVEISGIKYRIGDKIVLYGRAHDITERKKAEDELLRQRAMLARTESIAHVGSWEWDISRDQVTWSEELFSIVGLDPAEGAPSFANHSKLYLPEDMQRLKEAVDACLKDKRPYEIELRAIRKNGEIRYCLASGRPDTGPDGKVCRLVGFLQDITERKRQEEEKEKLHEQLIQAQRMESVGRLAGGVAHDFNNMLSVILGYAEMAKEQVSPDHSLHANLEEILTAAARSRDITRQLLAFARRQTISPVVMDINKAISGMISFLDRLIGEDIELDWRPGEGLCQIRMDPSQIDQILVNLCVNARDAIRGGGKISIKTVKVTLDETYVAIHPGFAPGEFILLTVKDNGCGMDQETLESVFEPFFTTKEMAVGTGLGLATVYGIVKQNSGQINVYSEPGKGTCFKLYLPCHKGAGNMESVTSDEVIPTGSGETILLVEDEDAIMKMISKMLEKLGYKVLTTDSPEKGLEMVSGLTGGIDMLITDVVMPGMNGRDLANRLLELYPDIKVLFMSGYTADVIANRGVLDDGLNFIQKPFTRKALAVKVRNALDKKQD